MLPAVKILRDREPWGAGKWYAALEQGRVVVATSDYVKTKTDAIKEAIKLAAAYDIPLATA